MTKKTVVDEIKWGNDKYWHNDKTRIACEPNLSIAEFIEKLKNEIPENAVVEIDTDEKNLNLGILRFKIEREETDDEYSQRMEKEKRIQDGQRDFIARKMDGYKAEYERLKAILEQQ